jgi:hypothetical protein
VAPLECRLAEALLELNLVACQPDVLAGLSLPAGLDLRQQAAVAAE